jgi:hypothetical protein
MVIVRAATAVALAMLAVSGGSAQKPTLAPSIDLVEIDVVVTDHDGQHVPGLKREDFEVKEDGKVGHRHQGAGELRGRVCRARRRVQRHQAHQQGRRAVR